MKLKELYRQKQKVVVTAHRGFSGRYPENTLTAFRKAMEIGADIVEFDVRETSDGQLVILHDRMVDRTTNGQGAIRELPWAAVRTLNATYWHGGTRHEHPAGEDGIPLLTDALALMAGKVGLNIQVYTESPEALGKIVSLYLEHGLQESAFLMLASFRQAEAVRALSREVAICVGEERENIARHVAFGVDFMQPRRTSLTGPLIGELLASGIPFNVFSANTEEEMRWLLDRGVRGILTDHPDRLLAVVGEHQPA